MKATIDRDGCIGCGLCSDICPKVFRMANDGYAEVYTNPVPSDAEDETNEAANSCPVSVITVE